MVIETLKYKSPSAVLQLEQVILEPELTQQEFAFMAEIVDSQLIAETFYRLHRITTIKTGRIPGHETRVRYSYDPIITVDNGFVDFETFSLDMCYYCKARFYENAFKNIEHWECGVTNVDFSKSFIKQVRDANHLNNIFIDPEGLELLSETESFLEKKIPLPENWRIALDGIKTSMDTFESTSPTQYYSQVLNRIPFNPYLRKFGKIKKIQTQSNGWHFIEMEMRNHLGKIQIALTPNQIQRMDGRKNINYEEVRRSRSLRTVKSYYLEVEQVNSNTYRVSGGHEPHLVRKMNNRLVCDCGDYVHRRNRNCKHIRAVNKPKLITVQIGAMTWIVTDGAQEYRIELKNNQFHCNCFEFRRNNVCQHLVEVMHHIDDYQYKEVKLDFS